MPKVKVTIHKKIVCMSWYKKASLSFIDNVGVAAWGDSYVTVVIGTKRYNYSGTDGHAINNKISQFKKMKNKQKAGALCSQFIKKLKPFLQVDPEPQPEDESVQALINRSEETLF